MTPVSVESFTIAVRGVEIVCAVTNPRLRVWAERFEDVEPELLDLIDSVPEGSAFFDAGASIGLFSLYAALKRRCNVVAVEPEAQNYATLELNHFLNRERLATPLQSFSVALSDAAGVGRIFTRTYGAGEHVKILDVAQTRDTNEPFAAAHVQSVIKLPLDALIRDFGIETPDVLKIDVDGSEPELLAGSKAILRDAKLTTIFIELEENVNASEGTTLESYGFRLEAKIPVVRLSGGVYPGLYNCVYRRASGK